MFLCVTFNRPKGLVSFLDELKGLVGFDGWIELVQSQLDAGDADVLRLQELLTSDSFLALLDEVEANEVFIVSPLIFSSSWKASLLQWFFVNRRHFLTSCLPEDLTCTKSWLHSPTSLGGKFPRLSATLAPSGNSSTPGLPTTSPLMATQSSSGLLTRSN